MEDEWNQKILRLAKGMRKCYKIKTITQIKGHTRNQQVKVFFILVNTENINVYKFYNFENL